MKKIIVWMICLLTVLSFSGCEEQVVEVPPLLEPVGVKISTAVVKKDTIYSVKSYDGQIVPAVEELSFVTDGKLKEILVQVGDYVQKGQVLATLDTESMLQQMEKLEEQAYQVSMLGKYSDRQAAADIEIAKVELERMRAEGASGQSCNEKELQIQKMELSLKQTKELRNMDLNAKYSELDEMEAMLEKNQIIAPYDGRIVHVIKTASGKSVKGYAPIMYIADDSKLTLQIDFVQESEFNNADKVYAHIMDETYDVSYIPYDKQEYVKMKLSGGTMKTQFSVDAAPGELEAGQFAVLLALNNYKEDVLTIPLNAVYRDENGRHVFKIVDGQRIRCDIKIGMITDTKIEIVEGLAEGDVICVDN